MATIVLDKLTKVFGQQTAVKELSLEIPDKSFVAFLGPSGCGKTTTMNMISGLLKPDGGTVSFDGKIMNDVPAGKRGVGFMFQNYAVFTHMNVFENIAFGLMIRKMPEAEIRAEVDKYAKLMQIDHLLEMPAVKLSVNDMQKTALARSMVTNPRIFLLDEPLSNLDASLRNIMRAELKKIQQELGQTSVYVTHDQIEAMSLADKIAVMNFAVLQQYDTPHNVYNRPANLFVAKFIGSPTMNFFAGDYANGFLKLRDFQGTSVAVSPVHKQLIDRDLQNERIVLGLRPEHLKLSDTPVEGCANLKAKIVSYEPLGSKTVVYLHPEGGSDLIIKSSMSSDYKSKLGEEKYLQYKEKDFYLFDEVTTDLVLRFSAEK
jgi:multiple sugar transport system ATP-binding protein